MTDSNSHKNDQNEILLELLNNWISISGLQKQGLQALFNEVNMASQLVETSVDRLSNKFLELASLAHTQSERIVDFSNDTTHLEFKGEKIPLSEILQAYDKDLFTSLDSILNVAKKSIGLSYDLDDMQEKFDQLIEHAESGKAVDVDELKAIQHSICDAKERLGDIATIDVSNKVFSKERIEELMTHVIMRSREMEDALQKSAEDSQTLSRHISEIITQMQFQDRTSQRLAHIGTTLQVMVDMVCAMENESLCVEGVGPDQALQDLWVAKIISDMNLGELKERFVKHTFLEDGQHIFNEPGELSEEIAHSQASDDIELF